MPLEESEEAKAERQARLSQAMGKLFLSDRVAKMESEANTLEFRRGPASPSKGSQRPRPGGNRAREPPADGGGARRPPRRQDSGAAGAPAVRVIDVSLLIYSLRTLHDWIKEGRYRLVVPLEALNTLDVLKKGDLPINIAARKATRFLDERIAGARPAPEPFSLASLAPQLVVQGAAERIKWADVVAAAPAASAAPAEPDVDPRTAGAQAAEALLRELVWSEPAEPAPAPALSAQHRELLAGSTPASGRSSVDSKRSASTAELGSAPLHVRETLSCFAWWEDRLRVKAYADPQRAPAESDDTDALALAVAFPPGAAEAAAGKEAPRFHVRADGRLIKRYAEQARMNTLVAPTASSWKQLAGAPAERSSGEQARPPSVPAAKSSRGQDPAPRIIFS